MRRLLSALLLSSTLWGCATTHLPPVSSENFSFEEDEKRLWRRSAEEQEVLDEGGVIYRDKRLSRYLNNVARKLWPPKVFERIPFRIEVIKNPYLNAFAYPNGVIYLHTGILARMENEAQLATLLAHEMTHATHRHAIREFRSTKNKTAALATLRFTIGHVPVAGDLASLLGGIGAMGAVSGYSKGLETQADTEGFLRVVEAGYDPRETPKLFLLLKEEVEAEKIEEPFFFGTHPRLKERIDNYYDLIETLSPEKRKGVKNKAAFLKKTRHLLLVNAELDLKAGRFQLARRSAEKYLALRPKEARAHYLMGEIYRQRGGDGNLQEAKNHFQKAISINRKDPDAHKGIAMVYYKLGEKQRAKKSFRSYLSLAPRASDRGFIEETIKQLD